MRFHRFEIVTVAAVMAAAPMAAVADFGAEIQTYLESHSTELFGFGRPVGASATTPPGYARKSTEQPATSQILLAEGLTVEYLTRAAGHNTDQMVLWPSDAAPTHLISCVEEFSRQVIGKFDDGTTDKYNPSVQRIALADGSVETIVRGMAGCDGIRRTAWGTIIVSEESSDGQVYELLKPLETTNVTITTRGGSEIFDETGADVTDTHTTLALRPALPTIAWEGVALTASGVVYGGDELRPGTGVGDADGGAIFKFVPATPYSGSEAISDLDDSPLLAGSVWALQVSCVSGRQQFGQGCEVGAGAWISINPATARGDADALGATGYYRPEDMDVDPLYDGDGIRFCWTDTQDGSASSYGEVICGVDLAPETAPGETGQIVVNRFVEGDPDFTQADNFSFQPVTGNAYVIEDNSHGDVWACLRDGADRDIKTDGCVKLLSVVDGSAEPTGFFFSPDGTKAYLSIQHSDDSADPALIVDDYGTDDILVISGFKLN